MSSELGDVSDTMSMAERLAWGAGGGLDNQSATLFCAPETLKEMPMNNIIVVLPDFKSIASLGSHLVRVCWVSPVSNLCVSRE